VRRGPCRRGEKRRLTWLGRARRPLQAGPSSRRQLSRLPQPDGEPRIHARAAPSRSCARSPNGTLRHAVFPAAHLRWPSGCLWAGDRGRGATGMEDAPVSLPLRRKTERDRDLLRPTYHRVRRPRTSTSRLAGDHRLSCGLPRPLADSVGRAAANKGSGPLPSPGSAGAFAALSRSRPRVETRSALLPTTSGAGEGVAPRARCRRGRWELLQLGNCGSPDRGPRPGGWF